LRDLGQGSLAVGRVLLGRVIEHQTARPAIAAGIRASLATTLPIAAAVLLDRPMLLWMALGAWLVALCDIGGAYATRATAMMMMTIAGAGVRFGVGLLSRELALGTVAMFAGGVAFSLLRVVGQAGVAVGTVLVVLLAVTLGAPPLDPGTLAQQAALIGAGGVASMAVALLFWRVHPDKPARLALARCFGLLADMMEDLRRLSAQPAAVRDWDAWLRTSHRRNIRIALEEALTTARATPGDVFLTVTAEVDRVFEGIVALSEQLEVLGKRPPEPPDRRDRQLETVVESLRAAAAGLPTELPAEIPPAGIERTIALILRGIHVATALLAQPVDRSRPSAPREGLTERLGRILGMLRAHLSFRSLAFIYALRMGLTTAAAKVVAAALHLQHAHWVVMTAAVCLQPSNAATWSRTVQRIGGTAAGAAAVALIARFAPHPVVFIALIAATTFAAVALKPVSYLYFAFFVTPAFVVFSELAEHHAGLAYTRVLDTLVGGLLALIGVALFWRHADDHRLRQETALAIERLRAYAALAFEWLAGGSGDLTVELREARGQFGIAIRNAEETFEQLFDTQSSEERATLGLILTGLRRVVASLLAARAAYENGVPPELVPAVRELARKIDAALAAAVKGVERPQAMPLAPPLAHLPDLPEELSRIANLVAVVVGDVEAFRRAV
jgi:uncharacterized membrane protein YccC